jgi:translation initiation factor IF-2
MMRIHELARRLGWSSKRVIATLKERGEFVASAMSKVEDPVARAMLRDFAADVSTPREQLTDDAIDPAIYGWSAARAESDADGRSFAADLARVKSQPAPKASDGKPRSWLPPIRRVLLYEMVIPWRPDHLADPEGDFYSWELRNAKELHKEWAKAQ